MVALKVDEMVDQTVVLTEHWLAVQMVVLKVDQMVDQKVAM